MRNQKPAWWLLYAIVPLMFGALVWNLMYGARGIVGDMIDVGIVVAGFVLMLWWLNFNHTALWNEEQNKK